MLDAKSIKIMKLIMRTLCTLLYLLISTLEYTNWEGGVDDPPLGCLSSGCTSDYGIVARPDAGMQWNSDEKSNPLPYICISRCKQGYKWHQGIYTFFLNTDCK